MNSPKAVVSIAVQSLIIAGTGMAMIVAGVQAGYFLCLIGQLFAISIVAVKAL